MVKALFDTNILIDFLKGHEQARHELARHEEPAISVISWMEVMAGAGPSEVQSTRAFLAGFALIGIDDAVAERVVELRKTHRMKLPDAIVWAAAQVNGMLLVTRDTKDFPPDDPSVRMPYQL